MGYTRGRPHHPRIRGEHTGVCDRSDVSAGSSPHTRGAHWTRWGIRVGARIIPAYAGSTPGCATGPTSRRDHPRIRGEHPASYDLSLGDEGSSPHTRGALLSKAPGVSVEGIIPAYAGSTSGASRLGRPVRDHPRIRGEHVEAYWYTSPTPGSSPHTRGARHHVVIKL